MRGRRRRRAGSRPAITRRRAAWESACQVAWRDHGYETGENRYRCSPRTLAAGFRVLHASKPLRTAVW